MVTTKSLSLEARPGHEGPVLAEFDGGMVNSVGLTNPGIREGLLEVDRFRELNPAPIIVSVFGGSAAEFRSLSKHVNDSAADFL